MMARREGHRPLVVKKQKKKVRDMYMGYKMLKDRGVYMNDSQSNDECSLSA